MSKATDYVLAERQRQQSAEGWTPEHDDAYRNDELLKAAVCYAWPRWPFFSDDTFDAHAAGYWHPRLWPWAQKWWKPCGKRRNLVKAAALLLAEIERLDRDALKTPNVEVTGAARPYCAASVLTAGLAGNVPTKKG